MEVVNENNQEEHDITHNILLSSNISDIYNGCTLGVGSQIDPLKGCQISALVILFASVPKPLYYAVLFWILKNSE